jgi:genome maintenance exonuclease 1
MKLRSYLDYHADTTPGGRFYDITDVGLFPSITTVLSATEPEHDRLSLARWRERIGAAEADKITDAACERGTHVHLMLERFMRGEDPRMHEFPAPHAKLFRAMRPELKHVGEIWGQEVVLYDAMLGVAGRCDMIAEHQGELAIIDYKTSSRVKTEADIEDYWLQTTFYALAHNHMMFTSIEKLVIIMGVDDKMPMVFRGRVTEDRVMKLLMRIDAYYDQLIAILSQV